MANTIKIRSAYDGTRVQVKSDNNEPSLTVQEQKDQTDINKILAKYAKTGVIEHVGKYEGQYGDVSGLDYQTMQNQIAGVNSMFAELPAKERAKFDNDPAKFLDYVSQDNAVSDMSDGSIDNIDNAPEVSSEAVVDAPEGETK